MANRNHATYGITELPPVYACMVEASGGHGERVDEPGALPGALDRALRAVVEERRQALVNVICGAS